MGEVYRARDTRLNRTVAIKILPEPFAEDRERGERFQREARAVAALNHPHICALHDVGEASSPEPIRFLVMEFLEGQTLEDRLVGGPLSAPDVLRYAIELADALDHAHRRGLVHRDLKPGNVMLTKTGAKLLDFGLSKLQAREDLLTLSTVSPGGLTLTAEGTVMGTFPYMSPEQLAGKGADARSDLFAFGAILHQMATGRRAFEGETAATLIGAILHTDPPPVSSLHPLAPSGLDRVVSRCLAKDPDDRWQSARDLMLELKWIVDHPVTYEADRPRHRDRQLVSVASASLAIVAIAAVAFVAAYLRRQPPVDSLVRFAFSPPESLKLVDAAGGGQLTISPDGKRLAFVAVGSDRSPGLWVQALDSPNADTLRGTDGASWPFWSPDSQFIGFFAQGQLKKVAAGGGPVQILCDAVQPRGASWSRDGVILMSANAGRHLYRVPAAGGEAAALTLEQPNLESVWPDFLPDGRHFVYYGRRQEPGIYLASLDSKDTTLLKKGYVAAAYASPGYLLLLGGGQKSEASGTLMAQPFDVGRLRLAGEPVPIAEQVTIRPLLGHGVFSVSANGRLVYGTARQQAHRLEWRDREGKPLEGIPKPDGYERPALSPDKKTVAAELIDPHLQTPDIWLIDTTTRLAARRFTVDPAAERYALWSPDGTRIAFSARRGGNPPSIYYKALNGVEDEKLLVRSDLVLQPTDWSRDGRFIVYAALDPKTQWDVWYVSATLDAAGGDRKPMPYLQTPSREHHGRLSPDGRWMAYTSDESKSWQVYVCAFPTCATRMPISTDGGVEPRWSPDLNELYYVAPDGTLMAVSFRVQNAFEAGVPRSLFRLPFSGVSDDMWRPEYVPARGGHRFLVNTVVDERAPLSVSIVLNWPAALRH